MFVVSLQDCQSTRRNLKKFMNKMELFFITFNHSIYTKKISLSWDNVYELFSQWQLPLNSGKNTTIFTFSAFKLSPSSFFVAQQLHLFDRNIQPEIYFALPKCISSLFNYLSLSNYAVKNTRVYHYIIYHYIPLLGVIYTERESASESWHFF